MKLFLFLSGFVFLIGCSGDYLNSLHSGDGTQQQLSAEGDFSPHSDQIRNLASEAEIVKIGSKRHSSVNVGDTVGQNNLRGNKKTRVVVSLDSDNVVTKANAITGTDIINGEAPVEVSFLIYMDDRKNKCVQNLRKHHGTFLRSIEDYNWQIAFAYHGDAFRDSTDAPLNSSDLLIPLQKRRHVHDADSGWFKSQHIHILSAQNSYGLASELFEGTLYPFDATYRPSDDKSPSPVTRGEKIKARNTDPEGATSAFSRVDQILQNHFANSLKNVVLFFGDNIPYYTNQEWTQFFQNNPNASLFFISTRQAHLSNIDRLLSDNNYDVNYVPGCDVNPKKYPGQYLEHLENLSGQIISRL